MPGGFRVRDMLARMETVTIYHNPHCNSSVNAVKVAEELGITPEIVIYRKTPPDRPALEWLIDHLEDEPTSLVRRDSLFKKLELTEDDVATREQIIEALLAHKMLLQRPIVVRGDRAIVGRPKGRVHDFLSE